MGLISDRPLFIWGCMALIAMFGNNESYCVSLNGNDVEYFEPQLRVAA